MGRYQRVTVPGETCHLRNTSGLHFRPDVISYLCKQLARFGPDDCHVAMFPDETKMYKQIIKSQEDVAYLQADLLGG